MNPLTQEVYLHLGSVSMRLLLPAGPLPKPISDLFPIFSGDQVFELTLVCLSKAPLEPTWPPKCTLTDDCFEFSTDELCFVADFAKCNVEFWLKDRSNAQSWNQLLRNLATVQIIRKGGLALHASAINDGQGAVIFVGPSGIGKTTTAQKYATTTLYSDEFAFLLPHNGCWAMHPVPPWDHLQQGLASICPQPVTAIYCLEQAKQSSFYPMKPVEVMPKLIHLPDFLLEETHLVDKVLDSIHDLLIHVPCWSASLSLEDKPSLPHLVEENIS